jgi:hypothetical protein
MRRWLQPPSATPDSPAPIQPVTRGTVDSVRGGAAVNTRRLIRGFRSGVDYNRARLKGQTQTPEFAAMSKPTTNENDKQPEPPKTFKGLPLPDNCRGVTAERIGETFALVGPPMRIAPTKG